MAAFGVRFCCCCCLLLILLSHHNVTRYTHTHVNVSNHLFIFDENQPFSICQLRLKLFSLLFVQRSNGLFMYGSGNVIKFSCVCPSLSLPFALAVFERHWFTPKKPMICMNEGQPAHMYPYIPDWWTNTAKMCTGINFAYFAFLNKKKRRDERTYRVSCNKINWKCFAHFANAIYGFDAVAFEAVNMIQWPHNCRFYVLQKGI